MKMNEWMTKNEWLEGTEAGLARVTSSGICRLSILFKYDYLFFNLIQFSAITIRLWWTVDDYKFLSKVID